MACVIFYRDYLWSNGGITEIKSLKENARNTYFLPANRIMNINGLMRLDCVDIKLQLDSAYRKDFNKNLSKNGYILVDLSFVCFYTILVCNVFLL